MSGCATFWSTASTAASANRPARLPCTGCAARVRQAQYLLEAITHSVDRVAMQVAQVGFGSATAFRDHFKQIVGTSPQAFRIA
jgi:methylphosphotriester-DNA--protein-cysteine methyltransferase